MVPSDDGTITNNTIEDNQGLGIDLAGTITVSQRTT
ncbi:hypothetical protein D8S78_21810 [Natrialba swarupiae]|nr:hypothetical protein [Natrialba swarupiae]